jgi:sec-independent protein translocase protein TatC
LLERIRRRRAPRAEPETMTLVEHLAELRARIIISLVAVAVGGVVGFVVYERVLDILQEPYCEVSETCSFIALNPTEGFQIRLRLSAYIGLLIASPVVLWNLWRFITPGLNPNEKKYAVPFVVSGVVLFLLGAAVAMYTFPQALRFLASVGGDSIQQTYQAGKYISLITFMMLAFGAAFEFPIVLVFLQLAGVLSWRRLASFRRYAIVLVFLGAAIITPSQDPISLLAMSVPMVLFYEGAILIGRFVIRR